MLPLRDSLLTALRTFAAGPRVILTQICLALADLALQLTEEQWSDPTSSMIDQFGKDPAMAGALLEWLQVLAEEFNSNFKIEVVNDFGRDQTKGAARTAQVVGLLSMYVQAPGKLATVRDFFDTRADHRLQGYQQRCITSASHVSLHGCGQGKRKRAQSLARLS